MVGAILFIVGNIASAGFVESWMSGSLRYPVSTTSLVLGGACGLAARISIPMMLIGREYQVSGKLQD